MFSLIGCAKYSDEVQANLTKLKNTKSCPGCDLSGIELISFDLKNADLSGANLTGTDATTIKDSGGTTRVQGTTSGIVITGIATAGKLGIGFTDTNIKIGSRMIFRTVPKPAIIIGNFMSPSPANMDRKNPEKTNFTIKFS